MSKQKKKQQESMDKIGLAKLLNLDEIVAEDQARAKRQNSQKGKK